MLLYVIIAVVVVLFVHFWWKDRCYYEKIKWVKRIPGWPIIGSALIFADPTKSLHEMERLLLENNGFIYVEVLKRPMIFISNYKFVEWLLSSSTVLSKSIDYKYLEGWLEDGILISEPDKWQVSRKMLTPTFHFSILEEYLQKFEKPASILVDLLSKETDKDSVDILTYMKNYTLDVICETTMGIEFHAQTNPHSEYVDVVSKMCRMVVERAFNPFKSNDILYKFTWDYYLEKKRIKYLHSISNSVIQTRKLNLGKEKEESDKTGKKKRTAFLDLLLNLKDENGDPPTDKFIREQVDTIMFAGHDTTAAALCFILYCLSNHAEEQEKVYQELKDKLGEKNTILYSDLQDLKYMDLVIKEALRLYPSVPYYARRATEDIVYDGNKIIPKGTTMTIIAYAINRNPNVFHDPEKFIPERFLNTTIKPFAYLPFSAGPRNCIGKKFAIINIKYTLSKLLLALEVLPTVPRHNVVLIAETVLYSKSGFKMRFRKRKQISA